MYKYNRVATNAARRFTGDILDTFKKDFYMTSHKYQNGGEVCNVHK